MKLDLKLHGNILLAHLGGRLDVNNVREIEKEIFTFAADKMSGHVIFNLGEVEFISSSGVALFVAIMSKLRQTGKKFVICNLSSQVKKVLELVEMMSIFEIFKDENDAFEYLSNNSFDLPLNTENNN